MIVAFQFSSFKKFKVFAVFVVTAIFKFAMILICPDVVFNFDEVFFSNKTCRNDSCLRRNGGINFSFYCLVGKSEL